jgi:hypothetical protein
MKLSIDYTFAYGDVMFGEYNGVLVGTITTSNQNVTPYPNENTVMNALTAKASYKLTDNVELGLGAGWAMFHMNNWQDTSCAVMLATGTCGAGGGALGLLTPGYLSPNYNVGTVMAMLKVKW